MTGAAERVDFLAGVRVLELGDGVAGAAATRLLGLLGAEVTAVVDPTSVHRRGRPTAGPGGPALLASILDHGKRIEPADRFAGDDRRHGYDLVVADRVLGAGAGLGGLDDLDDYRAFVDAADPGAWVTISAFGLTGPRAGDTGTELTIAAAGGMLASVRDEATGTPLKLGGHQSLLVTGQAGALAACHALDRARAGEPAHLDLSAVEATVAMGPVLEVGGRLLRTGAVGGAKRYGAPASFYPCTDGLVRISAMEDHQWRGVVEAMGDPAWAERFATVEARIDDPDEVDRRVAGWTRTRTKAEAEAVLQARGVPATAVYAPDEVLASPQLAHRRAWADLPVGPDGAAAATVGLPFRVVAGGEGPRVRRSLRGLRVLEASRVLAVPLCGAILGSLGAEVTKLEDLPRLDMYRRRGPYVDGEAGIDRSAYFALMNHSKASAAFDVDADRPRLDALVAATDVIVENLGRKRATALGMGATSAPAAHPGVLAVSSSGFGQDGPHADYRAYAYNLQASCALGYLTRNAEGASAEIDIAWADLISAYALATIVAAWAVGPAGNAGAGIDFAMADLIVSHFNEHLAAASLDPGWDASLDRANQVSPYAPCGVYPTADGWIAVAADADAPPPPGLDAVVAGAASGERAGELAARLRAAGVAAEAVATAADLVDDPHLAARGFLTPVVHGEWGQRRLVGLPWRPAGGPPLALGPPPPLDPTGAGTGLRTSPPGP